MSFTKVRFVIYADLECLLRKLQSCAQPKDGSFTLRGMQVRLHNHKKRRRNIRPRRFHVILVTIQKEELKKDESPHRSHGKQKPLLMSTKTGKNTEYNRLLYLQKYFDSVAVYDHNTGMHVLWPKPQKMLLRSHPKNKFIGPQRERKLKDQMDQWIAVNQETCLFCAEP